MKRIATGGIILAAILITGIPYLAAFRAAGADAVFGGFLLNPIDGNSYLAKMYQGWLGSWKFFLPYTAHPGDGAYIFLFYLFLGHLARWFHAPLVLVFHGARILGTVALGGSLYRFLSRIYENETERLQAFLLLSFGSGLGWLAFLFGQMTADFWVAEAYPILSSLINPHFPLALALLLFIFSEPLPSRVDRHVLLLMLAGLALAVILPFGIVVAVVVLGGVEVWRWIDQRVIRWEKLVVLIAAGAPMLIYQLATTIVDPVLAGWNAQNQTPSPPIWDVLVSLSPALILAYWGIKDAFERKREMDRLVVVWCVLGILLLYLPFGLQRRFMLGLYIPVAVLGTMGLKALLQENLPRFKVAYTALVALSIPTTLVILLAAFSGIINRDPMLYLSKGEADALQWIAENTPPTSLILASPDTGLLIPAHTGRRVIYGHPFETVDAVDEENALNAVFSQPWDPSAEQFIADRGVDYIWVGPRERELGMVSNPAGYAPVYQAEDVALYQVKGGLQGEP